MSPRLTALCVALAFAPAVSALAAQLPQPVKGDPRIRAVMYEPENVVTIYGRIGGDTMILFEKDEFVTDMSGGDTEAWALGVVALKNGISLKPKASVAATNINVVTTKRVYTFDMMLAPKKQASFWRVHFRYPVIPAAAPSPAVAAKERVDALMNTVPVARNRNYTVQGSSNVAPIEAWDDGSSTYLRFAANSTIPAVYSVREDGSEHLENFNGLPGDVLQIQGIKARFALRTGAVVACLFNEGFDAAGVRPATNTSSPHVTRTIKGVEP